MADELSRRDHDRDRRRQGLAEIARVREQGGVKANEHRGGDGSGQAVQP